MVGFWGSGFRVEVEGLGSLGLRVEVEDKGFKIAVEARI